MWQYTKLNEEDIEKLGASEIPSTLSFSSQFCTYDYIPRTIPVDEMPLACMSMLNDLGFIDKFKINPKTIARFVYTVKITYREAPYHNWSHAFSVCHFSYILIKGLPLEEYITDTERLALFVACLCHDGDHRGSTNSFQNLTNSALVQLYGSNSCLEIHHFAQAMCILNMDKCNIFETLTDKEYKATIQFMYDIIVATDIAYHLKIRKQIEDLVHEGFDNTRADHRTWISSLIITACDLSDQTKPWYDSIKNAENIYTEFFTQGDSEKQKNKQPFLMLDRDRACLPKLQIDFLDGIGLQCFKLLAKLFPETRQLYARIYQNRRCWVHLHKILDNAKHLNCNLSILNNPQIVAEVLLACGPVDLSPEDIDT